MIALRTSLAATMWMIDRIHRDAANVPTLTQPSTATRLADGNIFVLDIPDLPDSRAAFREDHSLLTGGQLEQRHLAFFRHQLGLRSRAARKLRAAAGLHFNRVDDTAHGNVLEWKCVTGLDIGIRSRFDLVADLQTFGSKDVALEAVGIVNQRKVGRAIRIVFQSGDRAGNAVVIASKIDQTQTTLMPTAAMARGHPAVVVTTTRMGQRREQTFLRLFFGERGKVGYLHEALARRVGLKLNNCHRDFPLS